MAANTSTPSFIENVNTTVEMNLQAATSSSALGIIFTIAFMLVALFICFGNGVVVAAIWRTPALQTQTNMFVTNLAVADVAVGVQIALVRSLYEYEPNWYSSYPVCAARRSAGVLTTCAGLLILVGISVDRFVGIVMPLHYEMLVTKRRVGIILVIIWAYSTALASPMMAGELNWQPGVLCETYRFWPRYYIHILSAHILIFAAILTLIYLIIAKEIRVQLKQLALHQGGNQAQSSNTTLPTSDVLLTVKALKAFITVVGIYMMAFIPFSLLLEIGSAGYIDGEDSTFIAIFRYSRLLQILNSAANPVVYALRMTAFREPMKRVLCFRSTIVGPSTSVAIT